MIDSGVSDMEEMKLGLVEAKFAEIIWDNEPMSTKELVNLCDAQLNWKRTTTYTVLKKLCNRGIFKTENSMIYAIVSREQFYAIQSEKFVEETFQGSLPAFIAAFSKRKILTHEEIEKIRQMIDSLEGE